MIEKSDSNTQDHPIIATGYKYKILDCNGCEIPNHYSGRKRTFDEAKKMAEQLNKDGEYSPYRMVYINNVWGL